MQQKAQVVIGTTKHGVLQAAAQAGVDPGEIKWGSRGYAGSGGKVFVVWGISPSPLARRAINAILDLSLGQSSATPRIFYVCYGGTHSSVVAAMLHLGLVSVQDIQVHGPEVLSWLPYFDRRTTGEIGLPVLLGHDVYGSEVYALGTGWLGRRLELCLCDLVEVACPGARACFCSVRGVLDFRARIGGFLSRRVHLVQPGRKLVSRSLANMAQLLYQASRACLDLSSKWKDNGNHSEGEVVWIDGSTQRGTGVPG